MKKPQFTFFQGSTPTLAFALPYTVGTEDRVYATFSQQGATVTEYTSPPDPGADSPAGSLVPDGTDRNILRIAMAQEDTFLFAAGDCELQFRIVKPDGRADTLFPVRGYVGRAQKDEVIS